MIKAVKTVLPFLSFEVLIHSYLVKTSMTHNKYLRFLILEDNDPSSAKSAAQILSLNLAKTFFLTTGLCSSRASCSFTLTPYIIKKLTDHTWQYSFDFQQFPRVCLLKSYL